MRTIVVLASLLTALIATAEAQEKRVTDDQARTIVQTIMSFRWTALEDKTVINFCAVPEFWDSTGAFIHPMYQEASRYRRRSDCPPPNSTRERSDYRNVTISGINVEGDTLVTVAGITRRESITMYEVYTITNVKTYPRKTEYRIVAMVSAH